MKHCDSNDKISIIKSLPYAGAWIETLTALPGVGKSASRSLTRERGLKQVEDFINDEIEESLPYAGAWIETHDNTDKVNEYNKSLPYAGAWIETRAINDKSNKCVHSVSMLDLLICGLITSRLLTRAALIRQHAW